jgi:hypothetical protein
MSRPSDTSQEPWHIAVLFSRTGLIDRHFLGTTLAIKHINLRGAVLGREIDIPTYDPGSDPATNGPPPARYPAAGRRC